MIKYSKRISAILTMLLILPGIAFVQQVKIEPVSLEQALERAPKENKKILVDVFASWCPYCQRMHTEVYPSEEVQRVIRDHFLLVRINVESEKKVNYYGKEMTQAEFAQALANKNVPTTYFLNDEGAILGIQPGFIEKDVFSQLLEFVGTDAYKDQRFTDYIDEK